MFLTSFKDRLPSMKNLNLVVLSRYRVDFYDIRDVRITGLVGEEELLGFDRETSRRFLIERGFPKEDVDQVIEKTGGHPLALILVDKEGFGVETTGRGEPALERLKADGARLGVVSNWDSRLPRVLAAVLHDRGLPAQA